MLLALIIIEIHTGLKNLLSDLFPTTAVFRFFSVFHIRLTKFYFSGVSFFKF
jgi:hypothetical protein